MAAGGDGDRQSGDGQVGGPHAMPGRPGSPMPDESPPDPDDEDG